MNDQQGSRISHSTPTFATQRRREFAPADAPPLYQQMPPSPSVQETGLLDLIGVLWRGKWIVVLCAVLASLAGGYYAYEVAISKYSATARLALQVRQEQLVDLESVMSGVSTEDTSINTELQIIRSRRHLEQLVDNLGLIEDPEFNGSLRPPSALSFAGFKETIKGLIFRTGSNTTEVDLETQRRMAVSGVGGAISVWQQRNTYLFNIMAVTEDPYKSARIANELSKIYLDEQLRTKFAATEYAVNWLSERVAELEGELRQREDDIKDLRSESELISLEALEALSIRAKDIRDRVQQTRIAMLAAQDRANMARALREADDLQGLADLFGDPFLQRLTRQSAVQSNRDAYLERVESLITAADNNAQQLEAQLEALEASLSNLQGQIATQNEDLTRLNQMVRETEATRTLYQTFLARLKETSVQIGLQQADSRVLSEALPGSFVQPRRMRIIVMCFILGSVLGAGVILARQFLQTGFRTAEALTVATGIGVFGQIPKFPINKRAGLIGYLRENPTSAASEAIRNLRTSVLLSNIDRPPQVIMSTSSVPGEGKTTVAISLAHNLSGLGKKVLLIEGDIRRRTFSEYFKSHSEFGLVSVVSGACELEEAIFVSEDYGVDVLLGEKTKTNAADFFSSERFGVFLAKIRNVYDYIVIDTPPVLVVPDTRIMGSAADIILYSVLWDKTSQSQIQEGLKQLTSVGLPVSGLVLSQIDPRGMKRYGYGGRYGSYGSYGAGYYDT